MAKEEWEVVGQVCVDTGSLALVDPSYVEDVAANFTRLMEIDAGDDAYGIRQVMDGCAPTHAVGVIVSPTGFGDGYYDVEVRHGVEGRVAEVRIRFL